MNNHTTVYIGMDVHKESFTLCCFTLGEKEPGHVQTIPPDHILVVKYVKGLRKLYGEETEFVCGYEAGCLGYTLYHQLKGCGQECVILAPTTMMEQKGKKRVKTDKRDAKKIAQCLAYHTYSPVHIPTEEDDQVKEYIRRYWTNTFSNLPSSWRRWSGLTSVLKNCLTGRPIESR